MGTMERCILCDGDQGIWSTCSLFAVCGALRQILQNGFGITLEDTQAMAEGVMRLGLRNADDEDIITSGIAIPDFVSQLNQLLRSPEQ